MKSKLVVPQRLLLMPPEVSCKDKKAGEKKNNQDCKLDDRVLTKREYVFGERSVGRMCCAEGKITSEVIGEMSARKTDDKSPLVGGGKKKRKGQTNLKEKAEPAV